MPSKIRASKPLNQTLALLNDPTPIDFDPEALEQEFNGDEDIDGDSEDDSEDAGDEEDNAREHYLPVGKSKLRGKEVIPLGSGYEGSKIRREDLFNDGDGEGGDGESDGGESQVEDESEDESEDGVAIEDVVDGDIVCGSGEDDDEIVSEDAMGSSDEERFGNWKFSGSSTTPGGVIPKASDVVKSRESGSESDAESDSESNAEESNDQESGSDEKSNGEGSSAEESGSDEETEDSSRRKAITQLLSEEKKAVTATVAKSLKTTTEKGFAVREQQKTFDTLIGARIKLQKGLVAINTLRASKLQDDDGATQKGYTAACESALNLWESLYALRQEISSSYNTSLTTTTNPKKRKFETTNINDLWSEMEILSASITSWRTRVLEKWSTKTIPVTTVGKRLNNTAPRSLTASIRESLSTDHDRLLSRTRVPRACVASTNTNTDIVNDEQEIFDDTDFYQQLLKSLINQRMVDNSSISSAGVRWTLHDTKRHKKKDVDTKASKGRKLRYTVHEKLVGFMAPEGNCTWRDVQVGELFSSLLGQRVSIDSDVDDENEKEDEVMADDGLRLFQ